MKKIFSQGLASVARKAKSAEAVAALGEQQEKTEALLEEAKVMAFQPLLCLRICCQGDFQDEHCNCD